jgi:hypothetical protein
LRNKSMRLSTKMPKFNKKMAGIAILSVPG